ncbi:hypothetical protein LCGC14_1821140 [marine sediment metagenome]|uniref:Uncharacterized protein n=1 Tax=marine sediment metagenome TaxID=412755 RepID=A0A0F9GJ47_9ZZZZ
MKCLLCEKEVKEVCGDEVCRKCHVSLSFDDCCDGTWAAQRSLKNGKTVEEAKYLYPDAKI